MLSSNSSPRNLKSSLKFVFDKSDMYKTQKVSDFENETSMNDNTQDHQKLETIEFQTFATKPTLVNRVLKNK